MFRQQDFLQQSDREIETDQYVIALELQLQREKEKNLILEQRLRNKQIFIVQMKEMQIELDGLTRRCQMQLEEQKRKKQAQKIAARQYLERIAELEHEISLIQNKNASEMQLYRNHFTNTKVRQETSHSKSHSKNPPRRNDSPVNSNLKQNDEGFRESFIHHFLSMVQFYVSDLNSGEEGEKKKLKKSWRWIKQVVKQWDQNKRIVLELQQNLQDIREVLNLPSSADIETVITEIQKLNSFDKQEKNSVDNQ